MGTRAPEDVVSIAGSRLYRAKREGRNRVVGSEADTRDKPVA